MSINFPTYNGSFSSHNQQPIKPQDYVSSTPSMLIEMTSKYQVEDAQELGSSKFMSTDQNQAIYLESSGSQNRQYSLLEEEDQSKSHLRGLDSRSSTNSIAWQSLVSSGGVADYLARLPIGLHHFLKLSSDSSREPGQIPNPQHSVNPKKKSQKDVTGKVQSKQQQFCKHKSTEKGRDGEIRLATALDGSTLFCCPECQVAYCEKELLDKHIQTHRSEKRFECDICGAYLKRKDHLTRHKQSHNPERPFICTICMKAFKRKEHLNLHFIMHSGEKSHICPVCGKGFYCKDHLDRHKQGHNPDRPFICAVCMKVRLYY
jgi:uncharacterized Zn-finger protein